MSEFSTIERGKQMANSEVTRFTDALKADPDMLDEVKQYAGSLDKVVEYAAGKGYTFTVADAQEYLSSGAGSELDEAQLDAVAGGKGGHPAPKPSPNPSAAVQTVQNVTTVVQVAEVVTGVAAVQTVGAVTTIGAAAEVGAVAVAVIVLT